MKNNACCASIGECPIDIDFRVKILQIKNWVPERNPSVGFCYWLFAGQFIFLFFKLNHFLRFCVTLSKKTNIEKSWNMI